MTNSRHIIRQQVLELSIASDRDARDLQEEVSDVFKSRVMPRMEQLFDKLSEEGQVLKIDRLEINLGDIDQVYLKEELPLYVERLLEEEITKLRYQQHEGIPGQVQAITVGWDDAKLAAFQYLLRTGVHAWNSTFKGQSLAQLYDDLSKFFVSQTREILVKELGHDYVRKRVVYQFNATTFESLIFLLSKAHGEQANALIKGLLILGKHLPVLSTFEKAWGQQTKETLLQVITFRGKEPATTVALIQQVMANLLICLKGHLRRNAVTKNSDLISVLIGQMRNALQHPEVKSVFKQAYDPLVKFLEQQDLKLSEGQKSGPLQYVETKSLLKSTYASDLQGDIGDEVTQKRGNFINDHQKVSVASKSNAEVIEDKLASLKFKNDKTVQEEVKPETPDGTTAAVSEKEVVQQVAKSDDALKQTEIQEPQINQATDYPKISAAESGNENSGGQFPDHRVSDQEIKEQSKGTISKPDQDAMQGTLGVKTDSLVELTGSHMKQDSESKHEEPSTGILNRENTTNQAQSRSDSETENGRSFFTKKATHSSHFADKAADSSDRDNPIKVDGQQQPTSGEDTKVSDQETTQERSHEKADNSPRHPFAEDKGNTRPVTDAPEQQPLDESNPETVEEIVSKGQRSASEIPHTSEQSLNDTKVSIQSESDPWQTKSDQVSVNDDNLSASDNLDQEISDSKQVISPGDSKPEDLSTFEGVDFAKANPAIHHAPSIEEEHLSKEDQSGPSFDADSPSIDKVRTMNRIVPHPEDRFVAPLWRKPPEIIEEAEIGNAGLALLWPYLPILFKGINWVKDGAFVSEEYQFRAIHFLQFMATGAVATEEQELTFNKLLVGLQPEVPVPFDVALTNEELEEAEHLLQTVLESWKALKSSSVDLLRQSFLQKEGLLKKDMASWKLFVERSAFDILLDRLPWSYSVVKLPWMDNLINVEW